MRLAAQPLAAASRPASLTAAPCSRSFTSLQAAEETLKNFCEEHGIPLTLKGGKDPMETEQEHEASTWEDEHECEKEAVESKYAGIALRTDSSSRSPGLDSSYRGRYKVKKCGQYLGECVRGWQPNHLQQPFAPHRSQPHLASATASLRCRPPRRR